DAHRGDVELGPALTFTQLLLTERRDQPHQRRRRRSGLPSFGQELVHPAGRIRHAKTGPDRRPVSSRARHASVDAARSSRRIGERASHSAIAPSAAPHTSTTSAAPRSAPSPITAPTELASGPAISGAPTSSISTPPTA